MLRPESDTTYQLTQHALDQMQARQLPVDAIDTALTYGRTAWTRGARIFAIGRREVERCRGRGLELAHFEGVQVVTSPDGAIVTVYRNRDLRGLRKIRRRRRRAVWCH